MGLRDVLPGGFYSRREPWTRPGPMALILRLLSASQSHNFAAFRSRNPSRRRPAHRNAWRGLSLGDMSTVPCPGVGEAGSRHWVGYPFGSRPGIAVRTDERSARVHPRQDDLAGFEGLGIRGSKDTPPRVPFAGAGTGVDTRAAMIRRGPFSEGRLARTGAIEAQRSAMTAWRMVCHHSSADGVRGDIIYHPLQ